jgi:hypothetical protein
LAAGLGKAVGQSGDHDRRRSRGMIEHGITTSKAHYWVHLFPLLERVFWYRVTQCRAYVTLTKPAIYIGKSKDGTPTGAGFLIPQAAYFVSAATIPKSYLSHINWPALTDREKGLLGQEIVLVLIEHGVIRFPFGMVTARTERSQQNDGIDCELKWRVSPKIEIKTELVTTSNLFVQNMEGGHRTNLTGHGERRDSDFPHFPEWPA